MNSQKDNGSEDSGDLSTEQLRCALEKVTQEFEEKRTDCDDLQQQCINLAGKLGASISNHDRAMRLVQQKQSQCDMMKMQLNKKSSEISRYADLFASKCEELQKTKEEFSHLEYGYHQAQMEIADLRKSLDMMQQREQEELGHFDTVKKDLMDECMLLKESLDDSLEIREELEVEIEKLKEYANDHSQEPNEEYREYETRQIIAERDELRAELEASTAGMKAQCVDLVSQLVKAIHERDVARKALAEAQNANPDYVKKDHSFERVELENKQLKRSLQSQEKRYADLAEQMEMIKKRYNIDLKESDHIQNENQKLQGVENKSVNQAQCKSNVWDDFRATSFIKMQDKNTDSSNKSNSKIDNKQANGNGISFV